MTSPGPSGPPDRQSGAAGQIQPEVRRRDGAVVRSGGVERPERGDGGAQERRADALWRIGGSAAPPETHAAHSHDFYHIEQLSHSATP
jgi:hypothetical protein